MNAWCRTGDWLSPRNPFDAPPAEEVIWDSLRVNQSRLYADMWHELFSQELGPLPEHVHAPCCAEFLVSKQRIQAHPVSFYQSCLDFLATTNHDRFWAGRVFEYAWHIMFGEVDVYFAPTECELLYFCNSTGTATA